MPIQIASSRPISALKRMFEVIQKAVLTIIVTAVKVTALPDVTSASRTDSARSPRTRISSMMRLTM